MKVNGPLGPWLRLGLDRLLLARLLPEGLEPLAGLRGPSTGRTARCDPVRTRVPIPPPAPGRWRRACPGPLRLPCEARGPFDRWFC